MGITKERHIHKNNLLLSQAIAKMRPILTIVITISSNIDNNSGIDKLNIMLAVLGKLIVENGGFHIIIIFYDQSVIGMNT